METQLPELNTGALLTSYLKKHKIYKASLARKMGVVYGDIFYYQKTKSMDVQKLIDFSYALNHNFLMDLAVQLPESFTTDAPQDTAREDEIKRLNDRVKILEAEKELLLKALSGR